MWPLPVFFSFLTSVKLMWAKSTGLTDWRAEIVCLQPQTSGPLGWLVMCASEVNAWHHLSREKAPNVLSICFKWSRFLSVASSLPCLCLAKAVVLEAPVSLQLL